MPEEPLIFNGKKYISSRRASEISGYHIDYLGQLSRKGELQSQMVGRNRYVSEESLFTYLHQASFKSPKNSVQKIVPEKVPAAALRVPIETIEKVAIHGAEKSATTPGFAYPIQAALPHPNSHSTAMRVATVLACAMLAFLFALPATRAALVSLTHSLTSLYSSSENISAPLATRQASIDRINPYLKVPTLQMLDENYFNAVDALERIIVAGSIAVREFALGLFDSSMNAIAHFRQGTSDNQVVQKNFTDSSNNSGNTPSPNSVSGAVSEQQVRQILDEELNKRFSTPSAPSQGMVVVPSTGSPTGDTALKQKIANSFSDNVQVELDNSKTSGVIKPEFKNPTNDSYLFLLVPVK